MATVSNRTSINKKTLSGIQDLNVDVLDTGSVSIGNITIQNNVISGVNTISSQNNSDIVIQGRGTGDVLLRTNNVNRVSVLDNGQVQSSGLIVGLGGVNTTTMNADHGFFTNNLNVDSTLYADVASGFVGIGTLIPNDKLHVAGSINIDDTQTYKINSVDVLSQTSLGTGITQSNLQSVGVLNELTVSGQATMENILSSGVATFSGVYATTFSAQIATFSNISMNPVAFGIQAGQISQGIDAISIGSTAGQYTQRADAIAIGRLSGNASQASYAIGIGVASGRSNQGDNSIAIGRDSGQNNQRSDCIAIGYLSGQNSQQSGAIAIGLRAGQASQGWGSIAIGKDCGRSFQGKEAVAIGSGCGNQSQGFNCVAIGINAGRFNQGERGVAVGEATAERNQGGGAFAFGFAAGQSYQGADAIAMGFQAGQGTQGRNAIALGRQSGFASQGSGSIALGFEAGRNTQSSQAVAIGIQAGQNSQAGQTVAIGYTAGQNSQGGQAVAIGNVAGQNSQGLYAIAIGQLTGSGSQNQDGIALGRVAGFQNQGSLSIAIGAQSGQWNQGSSAIAIGNLTGNSGQGSQSIAIGSQAGEINQGINCIAVGLQAGDTNQGANSIAIGRLSGASTQGSSCVAIGTEAGEFNQRNNAVAIGDSAGYTGQGNSSIAIGIDAGFENQGASSIAIGANAGLLNQHPNSIILNATGTALNSTTQSACFINPIRQQDGISTGVLCYNTTSKEITYSQTLNFDNNVLVVDMVNNRVGINTSTPSSSLSVIPPDPSSNFPLLDFRNTTNYGIYAQTDSEPNRGNTLRFLARDFNSGSITTRDVLTMRPEGRVGIGTATPSQSLSVVGNTTISGDLSVDTNVLRVDSTNNRVGINITSPTTPLDVSGNTRIVGNLSVENPAILATLLYADNANQYVGVGTNTPNFPLHIVSSGVEPLCIDGQNTIRSSIKWKASGGETEYEVGIRGTAGSPDNSFYIFHNKRDNLNVNRYRLVILENDLGTVGLGRSNPDSNFILDTCKDNTNGFIKTQIISFRVRRDMTATSIGPNTSMVAGGTVDWDQYPPTISNAGWQTSGAYNGMWRAPVTGYYQFTINCRFSDGSGGTKGVVPKRFDGRNYYNIIDLDDNTFWCPEDGSRRNGSFTDMVRLNAGNGLLPTTYNAQNMEWAYMSVMLVHADA